MNKERFSIDKFLLWLAVMVAFIVTFIHVGMPLYQECRDAGFSWFYCLVTLD